MDAMQRYAQWCAKTLEDPALTAELTRIAGDEKEIYERFYTDLTFGTAGLRGVLGAGTNRMNLYTVRRATQGMADMLREQGGSHSAAVAYDSRNNSALFARATAAVLAANGVTVYLYEQLAPTPMLSWAVRYYKCSMGVMITASHNPAEYNGYKAYGPDGCQIGPETADRVLALMQQTDLFDGVLTMDFDAALRAGKIQYVSQQCIAAYYDAVLACRCKHGIVKPSGLTLVYTPLNGTGNLPVRHILSEIGMDAPFLVEEQLLPDGNFPTCSYPNPELPEAMARGLALAREKQADILIGTDPDADRLGVGVRHNGEYTLLTGNEVGVLLIDYIGRARTEQNTMPHNPILVKSVVTTELADKVAAGYGIETVNVLTGFKYIGEQIALLEEHNEADRFVLGFEESCGYLPAGYVRDKDAVVAAMLVCEMAAYYKLAGKTLPQVLEDIYHRYGAYHNHVTSTLFAGSDGMKQMAAIMDRLFAAPPTALGGDAVVRTCNYRDRICNAGGKTTPITLPPSEILSLSTEKGDTVVIRPSGTEPKLKVYYMVRGESMAQARQRCDALGQAVTALLQ